MESLWIKTEKEIIENKEKLDEEIETEICIIGGGITGISTAYYLSQNGKSVITIDREKLSYETTGHTTAKITSQHDLFYKYLIDNFSKEYAKQYYEANQEAIENIEKIIKKEHIECDFKRQDAYVFTKSQEELKKIKDEVEAVKEIGGRAEFVEEIEPPVGKILGAIRFENQAMFNPRKYLKGLINKIIKNGGKFYEETKAFNIKEEKGVYKVYTDKGTIKAKYVVIATHYPIINTPGFYFLKMYQETSYVIGVETEHKLFEGMYINAEKPTISLRTAKDNEKDIILIRRYGS